MPEPTIDPRWAELFSVMVHDVRTPMTVVAGYVDMLLKERFGPLTDKQRQILQEVQKSCGRVSGLLKEGSELTSISGRRRPSIAGRRTCAKCLSGRQTTPATARPRGPGRSPDRLPEMRFFRPT